MRIYFLLICGLFLQINLSAQALFKLEKLHSDINTEYDEITPVLSRDGRTLCFTRVGHPNFERSLKDGGVDISKTMTNTAYMKRLAAIYTEIAEQTISNPTGSDYNQDIWIAQSFGQEFGIVTHPSFPLNNALPNSVCAIPPDEKSVIVINQFDPNGGMRKGFSFSNQLGQNNWSNPTPILIEGYENIGTDVGLTMSNDGNIIILTMNSKGGRGDNDLYVSFRTGAYSFSKPENIGKKINTKFRETTPFLTVDNQTLYFSSNRKGGLGGNDIYYCKRLDDTWKNWSKPEPMPEPINSKYDDSQPYYNVFNGFLYFSSKRDGSSDIFRVRIEKPIKETVTIIGRVYNPKNDETVLDAKIQRANENSAYFQDVFFAEDGTFQIELPKGAVFDLIAEKDDHIGEKRSIEFNANYLYFKDYRVDLPLSPIEAGTKLNLKPIYFKRSTATILEKSFPALDELADYLNEHLRYYVIIEGHTDNQGKEEELKELSRQRAEAIKEYLVYKRFIKPVRLETVGYGGEQPVTDNSTEELRAENRRVEAVILTVSHIIERPKGEKVED